jgi:glyoxylase-like metal-dependent hydrolase (beta-lactamase superfamily II)
MKHSTDLIVFEKVCVGAMQVNCYILGSLQSRGAIIIDPGDEYGKIKRILDKNRLAPAFIINTHGHIDHIGADKEFDIPIYIHKDDVALLKNPDLNLSSFLGSAFRLQERIYPLGDGQNLRLDRINLEVIHTPGHTPGGISLLLKNTECLFSLQGKTDKIVFTGDTLFCAGIGRTDFPGASERLLIESIKRKLLVLADETVLYPGHGPASTIAQERNNNPFLI